MDKRHIMLPLNSVSFRYPDTWTNKHYLQYSRAFTGTVKSWFNEAMRTRYENDKQEFTIV